MSISAKRKNRKLRVACYVRVSHDEQVRHGFSLAAQRESLQKWIKENGHSCAGWYVDEGVTARKKLKNRRELQRLLGDIQCGGIDLIIFIKLDRYFRSVAEYHETQKILEFYNTDWKAIEEDYDTTTTDGRFKINIMLSIAEQEADRTSDRIKFTNAHKIKKKQPIFGEQPVGYKIGTNENGEKRIVKDEAAAPAVAAVFEHFLQYQSISSTVHYINRVFGYGMHYRTVKKILTNTYYFGHYRGTDDYCPAYIDKATSDKIRHLVKNRNVKTPQSRRVYLFSGLAICPECGNKLGSSFTTKGGKNYLNYKCPRAHQHRRCNYSRTLAENKLEAWLLEKVKPMLKNHIADIEIEKPAAAPVGDRSEILAEMERLSYMFQKNRISMQDYDAKYSALEIKLEKLDAAAPAPVDVSALRAFLDSDILELYAGLSREDKRAAWRQIIDKIIVDRNGDHTVIFL